MDDGLTIGELARRAEVTAKAIRFYERTQVLPPARRAANRYRLYDDDAIAMLHFVKQASGLGLTLAEIREIIAIRRAGRPPCAHTQRLLRDKAAALDHKFEHLLDLRRRIRGILLGWKRRPGATAAVCPHIESSRNRPAPERAGHVAMAVNGGVKIGQLARQLGVTARAIRFYEAKRVLPRPTRGANGYRLYGRDAVATLSFVKQAAGLGLSLVEIREIIAIREGGRLPCAHVRRLLPDKARALDRKFRDLIDMRRQIRRNLASWSRRVSDRAAVCPHIEGRLAVGGARSRRATTSSEGGRSWSG
ncbi:MAG TPA: MerR family transcriptional regulator [Methylomirabilota bacterium]|nr:MerR family transcriptional regulator [Methylomirabilota bacterium]